MTAKLGGVKFLSVASKGPDELGWYTFHIICKVLEWVIRKLTSEVTTVSCVQEKRLSHSVGFPLKLVSIVPHLGTSFSWTRETATLVKAHNLPVSGGFWLTHSLNRVIHLPIRLPIYLPMHSSIPHPSSHLSTHAALCPSTLPALHWHPCTRAQSHTQNCMKLCCEPKEVPRKPGV